MKFIYLADTHIGGSDDKGYRQQSRYVSRISELMDCLAEWIRKQGDVAFVIHGGDMVENTSMENIRYASELFRKLSCPVYLSLGNHDLTSDDSVDYWLTGASDFFPGNSVDFSMSQQGVDFHFSTCHWGNKAYFWDPAEKQLPHLLPSQFQEMRRYETSAKPLVLITHSPIFGLPSEQSGLENQFHSPEGEFSAIMQKKTVELPAVMVLGAHNHMNMNIEMNGVNYVTVSAFTETPFEFKLFEITDTRLSMKTVSLASDLNFKSDYCLDRKYVQGRSCDRFIERRLK
jgi:DNA repair exonuclease SbcCD nuclease subunit